MTDASFNNINREVEMKILIYLAPTPLEITKSNYLIDFDFLEETGADSKNPVGSLSANEISFGLYNDKNIFSPTNATGPYAGQIKNGVRVEPFMKTAQDTEWVALGIFYVTSWVASITGATAEVTATDKLEQIFTLPNAEVPTYQNISFTSLYRKYFELLGVMARVDTSLTTLLPWGFIRGKTKEALQSISTGALTTCNVARDGILEISSLTRTREIRATLTDADQIINISAEQSTIKNYDGVEMTYYKPQLTEQENLLSLKDYKIPTGLINSGTIKFSKTPVAQIAGVRMSVNSPIALEDYSASAETIKMQFSNGTGKTDISQIDVFGKYIEFVPTLKVAESDNAFKLDSQYLQTDAYADYVFSKFVKFVQSDIPVLNLSIRGNPNLQIGDKLHIVSERYNIDYTGILQRASYKYNGGLTCDITLLNSLVFEEVIV